MLIEAGWNVQVEYQVDEGSLILICMGGISPAVVAVELYIRIQ